MTVRSLLVAGWLSCLGMPGLYGQDVLPPAANAPRKLNLDVAQPMPAPSSNQHIADAIASALGRHGLLKSYRIDVLFNEGVAELEGKVLNPDQRELARQIAMSVPGVVQVRDRLIMTASDTQIAQEQIPFLDKKTSVAMPIPSGVFPPMPSKTMDAPQGMPQGMGGYPPAPMPIFEANAGALPNPQYQPPPMPPYAWPSYAPYNNYSRVAQPKVHNYNQFPFIGPMYPYPKIPLGWRRVTLEWQDGSWWYGRESNSHDWWRVRYW